MHTREAVGLIDVRSTACNNAGSMIYWSVSGINQKLAGGQRCQGRPELWAAPGRLPELSACPAPVSQYKKAQADRVVLWCTRAEAFALMVV
jgi:hypothetical protein